MPEFYVRHTSSNTSPYDTWAKAATALATALAAASAGDTIYVSDNHAETSGSAITLTSPGTPAAPCKIICGDDAAEPPTAVATTATITTTAGGSSGDIALEGFAYCYGISFNCFGSAFKLLTDGAIWILDNCLVDLTRTVAQEIRIGALSGDIALILLNSNIGLSHTDSNIRVEAGGNFQWIGGTLNDDVTDLIDRKSRGGNIHIRDVDLSVLTNNIYDIGGSEAYYSVVLERCKLNAAVTFVTGTISSPFVNKAVMHSCDSANKTNRIEEQNYEGVVTNDTSIYIDATDGTDSFSLKMVSSADSEEFILSLISPPITAWTDSTTEKTFTVEFVFDSATDLDNDEIWMELEYPGADAQGDIANDRAADILAIPAVQTTSTETWTGTGGFTNENKQKLSVTVTPGKAGQITARVHLAKPSTTVYVNFKITES